MTIRIKMLGRYLKELLKKVTEMKIVKCFMFFTNKLFFFSVSNFTLSPFSNSCILY